MNFLEGILMSWRHVISWVQTNDEISWITLAFLPVNPPGFVSPREFMLLKTTEGKLNFLPSKFGEIMIPPPHRLCPSHQVYHLVLEGSLYLALWDRWGFQLRGQKE